MPPLKSGAARQGKGSPGGISSPRGLWTSKGRQSRGTVPGVSRAIEVREEEETTPVAKVGLGGRAVNLAAAGGTCTRTQIDP